MTLPSLRAFTPAVFNTLNALPSLRDRGVRFGMGKGMSAYAIKALETRLSITLPNDVALLLACTHDPESVFTPWADMAASDYQRSIEWILHGIEFDIESNGFWLNQWGPRPDDLAQSKAMMREAFKSWPRLFPLYGHRFIVMDPALAGNPIFSIKQTDIIYYGRNLFDYLMREFGGSSFCTAEWSLAANSPERIIPVWHDLAMRTEGVRAPR